MVVYFFISLFFFDLISRSLSRNNQRPGGYDLVCDIDSSYKLARANARSQQYKFSDRVNLKKIHSAGRIQ